MESMIGKTISNVKKVGVEGFDDVPYLYIEFTDGTVCEIESNYGGYTGKSEDEYPRFIEFSWVNEPMS